jgi:hypothetical protein
MFEAHELRRLSKTREDFSSKSEYCINARKQAMNSAKPIGFVAFVNSLKGTGSKAHHSLDV